MKRQVIALALSAALMVTAVGCGNDGGKSTTAAAVDQSTEATTAATTEVKTESISGVINKLGDQLLLITEQDQYFWFSIEGVDVTGLAEGDSVVINYTGELVEKSENLKAVTIEKK